jgi:hypothetical protein
MALGYYFTPKNMGPDVYDEGETLIPILTELGVDPGQPHVAEVHNVIVGS